MGGGGFGAKSTLHVVFFTFNVKQKWTVWTVQQCNIDC